MSEPTPTGNLGHGAWTRSRHRALVRELVRRGIPRVRTDRIARAVLAHWARETRWGEREWDFNIGNIKAFGYRPAVTLADGLEYRSYPTLAEGVRATVDLLTAPRYASAWAYLLTQRDDAGWYSRLMHAGWHPWSEAALTEYRSVRGTVDRHMGAQPTPTWRDWLVAASPVAAAVAAEVWGS